MAISPKELSNKSRANIWDGAKTAYGRANNRANDAIRANRKNPTSVSYIDKVRAQGAAIKARNNMDTVNRNLNPGQFGGN